MYIVVLYLIKKMNLFVLTPKENNSERQKL